MFSTLQIIIIAFAYVSLLFLIAYSSDKNKPKVFSPHIKALVYSFSIAIYCTSWTFYGAVGSAAKTGWGYLPIYLGPILVYTVGWPVFKRFVQIGHEQNVTSISDFIASRYGKSQSIAAIVTIIAVIAIIPYIGLQLKAITTSIQIFDIHQNLFTDRYLNSLFITFLLIIFSILFGTRNLDVTEHQYGMMNAIAFESIIKLIAFCSIGFFALFSIFDGPSDLVKTITENEQLRHLWLENLDIENFITQIVLSAAAIFCLPRQFHVSVVEYHHRNDLKYARLIFPGYLILISLFVIPIVVAGSLHLSGEAINADTYILALPISYDQNILSVIVFIGGLSAATGMVIVATVALSTMISNDIVLPIALKHSVSNPFKDKRFNHKMLMARRIAIASCLLFSYLFYRLFDHSQSLASIGFLSFTAVIQFMPALLLGLFWSKATKIGATTGLLGGIICWFMFTLFPSLNGESLLSTSSGLTPFSLLTESLLISLFVNFSSIFAVSKITNQTLTEKIQAYAYTKAILHNSDARAPETKGSQVLVKDLKSITAAIVGNERMVTSYENFSGDLKESDLATEAIVRYTEKILSASIGAPSAHVVILSAFKEKGFNVDDVVNLLSSTSQALKFNRKMLEITMDNISQGISVSDAELKLIGWNQSYEQIMNYPKDLLYIGKPVEELITFNVERGYCGEGATKELVNKRVEHLQSGLSYRYERYRSDGIVVEIVGNPLPQGGFVTTYTDISEYKKIESALLEKEREIALYTDNSPALLAYLDNNLIFRFTNKTMAQTHNIDKAEIVGKKISEVLSKEELDFKRKYLGFALENRKQQFEYASHDQKALYYLVTYIPDVDENNQVIGLYTISQDISNRRKAELALREINTTLEQRVYTRTIELKDTVNELESAKAEAEQANRSKSRFLAAASHDLLQPLNAARLFSEMLISEKDSMSLPQSELVEKTANSLNIAENIISSLIDVSKLDSGNIRPVISSFNINNILDSLEKQFSGIAAKKQLKLKVTNKDLFVDSDPKLLYRIMQNFVGNAIRYTNEGGILVSTQRRKDFVRLSVWDTGIGIKEENKNVIFNEFKQLTDPENNSEDPGIGLGLSISKRLAKLLNHPIELNSSHGKGSAFHLLIKCSENQETIPLENMKKTKVSQSSLSGSKILCVDNEEQITDAMFLLLKRWECDVATAHSEEQIDAIIADFIPDIMVVDYQLEHGKTGLEFIDKVRDKTGKNIPGVIVTADHSNVVESKIKEKGHKLLYKPVKPAMLRATINNQLRK